MTRCKYCRASAPLRNDRCTVCGIMASEKPLVLSSTEKKVRFHARAIRLVAMLHLIAAAGALLLLSGFPEKIPLLILAGINAGLAIGLSRYSLWAYKGATILYFFIGMVGVISIQKGAVYLGWITLSLVALYLIGNGTSKSIFERELVDGI
jgi:hypothetical protein